MHSFERLLGGYRLFCEEFGSFLPYIWLEPMVANAYEHKVLILSNDVEGSVEVRAPIHVHATIPKGAVKNATDLEVEEFAKEVFIAYKESHG